MKELVREMHPLWGFLFIFWSLVWVVAEGMAFLLHSKLPTMVFGFGWLTWMLLLLIAEIIGLIRKKRDDETPDDPTDDLGSTMSEMVWNFLGEEPAKAGLGIGIAIALSIRVTSLPFLFSGYHMHFVFVYGPWLALGAGLLAWLVIHFPNRRRWMGNQES